MVFEATEDAKMETRDIGFRESFQIITMAPVLVQDQISIYRELFKKKMHNTAYSAKITANYSSESLSLFFF